MLKYIHRAVTIGLLYSIGPHTQVSARGSSALHVRCPSSHQLSTIERVARTTERTHPGWSPSCRDIARGPCERSEKGRQRAHVRS